MQLDEGGDQVLAAPAVARLVSHRPASGRASVLGAIAGKAAGLQATA
jgi:hypothetical protein